MSVTELMVAICIVAILAVVAIPSYISYVQQARVVSLIIPRLHAIETSIGLFFSVHQKLPFSSDADEILKDCNTENLDVVLAAGTIVMTIKAAEKISKLNILDGKVLIASPVISKSKITYWHLDGELAERLMIKY